MSKDSKKMATVRSRLQMGVKKGKAAACTKAVRRAAGEATAERQTKRRHQRQKAQAAR